ncbi:MAG: hypothetical protein ACXAEX_22675 [Promethearchaeota archaeon]|jgi:hypothetical protein
MELNKALRITTSFLEVAYVVLLIGSLYSIISVFSTAIPVNQEINIQMSDPVTIPLTFTPKNEGFLETDLSVSLDLVSGSKIIASDKGSLTIAPGTQGQLNLELSMSSSDAIKYLNEGSDVTWVTVIETSTLLGFFQMSDRISVIGGV